MITEESKLAYLFSIKADSITGTDIFRLFNKRTIRDETGKVLRVEAALFRPDEKIHVPKGQLECIKTDIDTTAGRYLFNLCVIERAFKGKYAYINKTLRSKEIESIHDKMVDDLLMKKITGAEFGEFQKMVIWLNNFTEIFIPGTSDDLMVLPPEIKKELDRLVAENQEIIASGDTTAYINAVETPIIEFARKWFIEHETPGWTLYAKGGKPNFSNVFKNMYLAVGPILDITTGKYKISTACFSEGLPAKENYLYANQGVFGAFNRAVNTQVSGYKTKLFCQAFQHQTVVEEDCGSPHTIKFHVTDKNKKVIKWKYIKDASSPDGYTCVTPDKLNEYVGKTVEYRSPMYCMTSGTGYCWRCMGELFKRVGIKNVGLSSQKLTSVFMNKSLKSFHDTTLKTTTISWQDCFYSVK